MRKRKKRRSWSLFDWFRKGPRRSPRVTDDDDDGLAGAPVPRRPIVPQRSGGAALAIPLDDYVDVTAIGTRF